MSRLPSASSAVSRRPLSAPRSARCQQLHRYHHRFSNAQLRVTTEVTRATRVGIGIIWDVRKKKVNVKVSNGKGALSTSGLPAGWQGAELRFDPPTCGCDLSRLSHYRASPGKLDGWRPYATSPDGRPSGQRSFVT